MLVSKAQPACALYTSAKIFKLSLSLWWTKAYTNFMHFHIARILLKTPSHINIAFFFFFNLIWENTHKNPSLTKYFTEQSTCQIKVVFKLKFKTSAEIKLRLTFIKHIYIKIWSILKYKKLLRSLSIIGGLFEAS